jgi:predicted metal-dependent peptidase
VESREEIKKEYSEILITLFNSSVSDIESSYGNKNTIFFAHYLTKLPLVISNNVPTAGVGLNQTNDKACLYLGAGFLKYTRLEKIAILLHEVYHLICKHPLRREGRKFKLYNISCDMAINQRIKNIPKDGIFPEDFDFPKDLTSEAYYDLFIENPDKIPKDNEYTLIDCHDEWDKLSEENRIKIESHLNSLAESAKEKCKGNISASLNELINLNKYTTKVPWISILRKNLTNRSSEKKETLKRRNRRYRDNPNIRGHKKTYKSSVTVILDVSGSMDSEKDIREPLAEIKNLCKVMSTNVDLIQVDTEVKKVEKFKSNTKNFIRSGQGGTELYPAIEYCRQNKIDMENLVVITDGYIESRWENPPKSNIIFLIPSSGHLYLDYSNFLIKPRIFKL